MKSARLFAILIPAVALSMAAAYNLGANRVHLFQRENVLGTSFELKVTANSAAIASRAESAALAEISREQEILSSWDMNSEFSRWFGTHDRAVPVSPELFEVLSLFDTWRGRTGGALDAAAEAVTVTWKNAAREDRTPTEDEMARAISAAKQPNWKLDSATHTATHLSDTPLALNSFVKSYIMDHAAKAAMATPGVTAVVINIGGDLIIRGRTAESVNIADPRSDSENSEPIERLAVQDRAVATSGSYRRGFEIGGKHYSHIVDPRTGKSVNHILSATVIAPKPADAGALATTFCVLQPEESRRIAATMHGVDYLILAANGQRVASPGWKQYQTKRPLLSAAAEPPQFADAGMELVIDFELAQIRGGARRPYVAVWIENSDKFPVRTLALWYQKPRWLPDLRAWYRDDRTRAAAEGKDITASVASATRPPGKYSVKWDGKDNTGKPVKPGKYTVNIEAAREHGTYQIMRQEIEFDGQAKQFQVKGNQEISSASIDYRKAAR
ncbi:MAG TPA: DUF2271 domain-containing protein [Candidatus Solibacter sp.]|nr:DUF2271 domain-containing protein [Candidatus Solibacter sp.]